MGIFKEDALPEVEDGGIDAKLIAEVGNGNAFEKMAFEDSDLVLGGEMSAGSLVGHGKYLQKVMLNPTGAFFQIRLRHNNCSAMWCNARRCSAMQWGLGECNDARRPFVKWAMFENGCWAKWGVQVSGGPICC